MRVYRRHKKGRLWGYDNFLQGAVHRGLPIIIKGSYGFLKFVHDTEYRRHVPDDFPDKLSDRAFATIIRAEVSFVSSRVGDEDRS